MMSETCLKLSSCVGRVLKPHIKYNNSINLVLNTYKIKEYQDGNHLKKEMEGRKINIQYFKKFFGLMSWPKDILPLEIFVKLCDKKGSIILYFTKRMEEKYKKDIQNLLISSFHSFIDEMDTKVCLPQGVRTLKNVSKLFDDRHDTHYVSTEIISCKKYHVIYNL